MIGNHNQIKERAKYGFTLVELLVAMAVFSISASAIVGLFGSAVKIQMSVLERQSILDNISYSLEYMSRALRMAQKDLGGHCIAKGYNFQQLDGPSSVRFLNYDGDGKCEEFLLKDGQIMVRKSSDNSKDNLSSPEPLTSSRITVENLIFCLSGEEQGDELQPKVTIGAVLQSQKGKTQEIRVQTTVSQRNLDVQY
ncbi:prepilin-type N-terminal cleavage/methylation domain-containing protein [bacterium]|nr:prepilin-type N-terminal cleavage/methylation domain-containing protein [bacterium]